MISSLLLLGLHMIKVIYSKDKRQAHKLEVQEVLLLNSLFLIPQNEEFQFEHPETEIGR